jgi:hypothetical protein
MLTKFFYIIAHISLVLSQGFWPYSYGYNYGYGGGYGNGALQNSGSYNQLSQYNPNPVQAKGKIPNYSPQQLQQLAQQISDANRMQTGKRLSQSEMNRLVSELSKIQSIGQQKMQQKERKILFDIGDSRNSILNGLRSNVDLSDQEGGKDDRLFGLGIISSLIGSFIPIGAKLVTTGIPILVDIIKAGVPIVFGILTKGIPIAVDIIKAFIGAFAGGD